MTIKNTIQGDLLKNAKELKYTAIAHGCNTFANFGAGIAATIKKLYPKAYEVDVQADKQGTNTLGNISICSDYEFDIINCYTQDNIGWNRVHNCTPVCYTAIYRAFLKINQDFKNVPNALIGAPLIGAGLAKGDWNIISQLINLATPDVDIEVVIYNVL